MHRKSEALLVSTLFLVVMVGLTLAIGIPKYHTINHQLTDKAYAHTSALAELSAVALRIKLDALITTAQQYANDPEVITLAAGNDWSGVKDRFEELYDDTPHYDPYIDRIRIMTTDGVVRAAYPQLGSSLSLRSTTADEWVKALVEDKKPFFVSGVYTRTVSPRLNVIEVDVPITQEGNVSAVVSLQIRINNFSDFGKEVEAGSGGFAYIIDSKGIIVTHPKFSSEGPLIDYSTTPSVARLLEGETGTEMLYNPIERVNRLVTYQAVPVFGWGVIAQLPTDEAFEARNAILNEIALLMGMLILVIFLVAALMYYVMRNHRHVKSSTK